MINDDFEGSSFNEILRKSIGEGEVKTSNM